jgi:hypothetical protein
MMVKLQYRQIQAFALSAAVRRLSRALKLTERETCDICFTDAFHDILEANKDERERVCNQADNGMFRNEPAGIEIQNGKEPPNA